MKKNLVGKEKQMTPEEHSAICKECPERKFYARRFDLHIDWFDCWFDCENDIEHHKAEEAKKEGAKDDKTTV